VAVASAAFHFAAEAGARCCVALRLARARQLSSACRATAAPRCSTLAPSSAPSTLHRRARARRLPHVAAAEA
jgi:hypothetical protein